MKTCKVKCSCGYSYTLENSEQKVDKCPVCGKVIDLPPYESSEAAHGY